MKFPESRNFVIRTVSPILHEVGEEESFEKLKWRRLAANPRLPSGVHGPSKNRRREFDRDQKRKAQQQVIEREEDEIFIPLRAEDLLISLVGKKFFQENEDKRTRQEIENEPVETEGNFVSGEVAHLDRCPAKKLRDGDNADSGKAESATFRHEKCRRSQNGCEKHGGAKDVPNCIDVIRFAKLGGRQVFGKVKAEHSTDAEESEKDRGDSAYLSFAKSKFIWSVGHGLLCHEKTSVFYRFGLTAWRMLSTKVVFLIALNA